MGQVRFMSNDFVINTFVCTNFVYELQSYRNTDIIQVQISWG